MVKALQTLGPSAAAATHEHVDGRAVRRRAQRVEQSPIERSRTSGHACVNHVRMHQGSTTMSVTSGT